MRRIWGLAVILAVLGLAQPGHAGGSDNVVVVPSCGSAALTNTGNSFLGYLTVDTTGRLCTNGAAVPNSITGNAAGTTGAVVGTLAGVAGKTTYICGFNVSAIGGTAAVGPITIAGLIGSSMVFQLTSSATGASISQTFSPCIPASAANTGITITTTADGSASAVNVGSWGFQQ